MALSFQDNGTTVDTADFIVEKRVVPLNLDHMNPNVRSAAQPVALADLEAVLTPDEFKMVRAMREPGWIDAQPEPMKALTAIVMPLLSGNMDPISHARVGTSSDPVAGMLRQLLERTYECRRIWLAPVEREALLEYLDRDRLEYGRNNFDDDMTDMELVELTFVRESWNQVNKNDGDLARQFCEGMSRPPTVAFGAMYLMTPPAWDALADLCTVLNRTLGDDTDAVYADVVAMHGAAPEALGVARMAT